MSDLVARSNPVRRADSGAIGEYDATDHFPGIASNELARRVALLEDQVGAALHMARRQCVQAIYERHQQGLLLMSLRARGLGVREIEELTEIHRSTVQDCITIVQQFPRAEDIQLYLDGQNEDVSFTRLRQYARREQKKARLEAERMLVDATPAPEPPRDAGAPSAQRLLMNSTDDGVLVQVQQADQALQDYSDMEAKIVVEGGPPKSWGDVQVNMQLDSSEIVAGPGRRLEPTYEGGRLVAVSVVDDGEPQGGLGQWADHMVVEETDTELLAYNPDAWLRPVTEAAREIGAPAFRYCPWTGRALDQSLVA